MIFFRFRSYSGRGAHGFKIMYETLDCPNGTNESSVVCSARCSQTYYEKAGTLTFPQNLKNTSERINCAYDIIQEPGSYMKIKEVILSLPCGTAFLEIRDGPLEDSPLMGRFCNENDHIPANFTSSQNHIVIRLIYVFLSSIFLNAFFTSRVLHQNSHLLQNLRKQ